MGNSKIVYYGETLIDLTGDTVEAAKLLKGVTAHDKKGEKVTGTLADVTQATPAITVDAAGKITASATQAAGVVAAGTKSATKQLTVQAAKTVTPSASAQTAVAKGVFTTGIITVAAVYAVIGVTYPSGSTVTCTNGSKTLKAKDTSGKAMFIIPTKGTWTVKAVKNSQSASKAVSITAEGQVATVTLMYTLELYNSGNQYTDITGGWVLKSNGDTIDDSKFASDHVVISPLYPHSIVLATKNKIDLTNISVLKIVAHGYLTGDSTTYASGFFGISANQTPYSDGWGSASSDWVAKTNLAKTDAYAVYTLDVSSISGSYYVCVCCVAAGSYKGSGADVKQIVGE